MMSSGKDVHVDATQHAVFKRSFGLTVAMGVVFVVAIGCAQLGFSPRFMASTWAQAVPQATSAIKLNTGSQRVPQGTMLKIVFKTPLDSSSTTVGAPFIASLAEDFYVKAKDGHRRVVLPRGTMVRGRVATVKKARWFGRGAAIQLVFDHVVLGTGDLLPLDLNLSAKNDKVRRIESARAGAVQEEAGMALYSDPGRGYKIQRGLEDGIGTLKNITKSGIEGGRSLAGTPGAVIAAPVSAVGGLLMGGAVTTGKGVKALVGHGDATRIRLGDAVNIDFGGAFNLPTN